jgi:hypothetical protein
VGQIATIQSEGKIGSGFFGESFGFPVDRVTNESAKHTIQYFRWKEAVTRLIRISARDFGTLAVPDFCERCFWIKRHVA